MALPIQKVEVGFDTSFSGVGNFFTLDDATRGQLNNTTYTLGGLQFIDVTERVKNFSISRGRSSLFTNFPAGQLNVEFNNHDRAFDPLYTASPFAGNIVPRREIKVTTFPSQTANIVNVNLMTNPSFEGQSTTTTTNLITNPSFETDTSGWTIDRDAATPITRITTDSVFGIACAELNAPNGGGKAIDITATPNTTYVFSVYVKGEAGKLWSLEINERTAVASVGSTFAGNFTANGQWQRASVTRTFGATGVVARLAIRNAQGAQHTIRFDGAVLTTGTGTDTYFDGSTTGVNDTTFAWTGTANTSTSTRACNTLTTVRTNLFTNPSIELATTGYAAARTTLALEDTFVFTGNRSLRGTISSALSGQYIDGTQTSIVASTSYTFSCYVYLPATNTADSDFRLQFHPWTGSSYLAAISGTTVTIPRGVWTRLSVTGTMPSNATQVLPRLESRTTLAVGQVYITDGWLLEQSSALGDYFDGNTAASGDFIYRWNGVVSNSSSTQQVRQVTASPTGTNSAAGMSRVWDSTGLRSLVVAPTGASNDSHVRFSFSGLTSGATYTALVTCYLSAPLTGTLNSRTRQISAWNSTFTTNAGSATAPNTAGSHALRFTFTANDTTMILALHNGASVNNGLVWFDDLLLVAGNYQDEYFDGSTISNRNYLRYEWSGAVNASTSVKTQDLEVAGRIYSGWIDDWSFSYLPNGDSVAGAIAYDATSIIAGQTIGSATPTAQKTGARINYVLDTINWPVGDRNVDAGLANLGTQTIDADTNAISYLQSVAASEPGLVFIDKNGSLTFLDRSTTPNSEGFVLFGGTGIPFTMVGVSYGSDNLFNEITVARKGGGTAVITDPQSITDYGARALSAPEVLLANDADLVDLGLALIQQYSTPEYRFSSLEVALHKLDLDEQLEVLSLDLGSIAKVLFTPNGIGDPIERFVQVISINHVATTQTHFVEFSFQSVENAYLVLDDAEFGKLNSYSLSW